jgi:hypothetical protein
MGVINLGKILVGNLKGKYHSETLYTYGLGQGRMAVCYEHGNKHYDSIKDGEFLD